MAPAVTRFAECESSVFISYAHADNRHYHNWIEDFADELKRDLTAELARVKTGRSVVPPVHLSHLNGPTAGQLALELQRRVQRSFAMVIIVGKHYVSSDWCLAELRYFHEAFGAAGLDQRLFVVALADEPIKQVAELSTWQECLGGRNQVWQPYFEDGLESHRPLPVLRPDGKAPTQEFASRFDLLRDELVKRIKADLATPQASVPGSRWLIGAGVPELTEGIERFADAARGHGQPMCLLDAAALHRSSALAERLRDADRLVLPFNAAQPLYPMPQGGHLATQLQAWRRLGKADEHVYALDFSQEVLTADPAEPEHAAFLAELPQKLLPQQLLDKIKPPPPPTGDRPPSGDVKPVKLFIESNRFQSWEWKPLGEQIRLRWQKLLDQRQIRLPLKLRPSGLNIDEIRLFNMNDADGVILLWGSKEKESLVSQINLVEDRLLDAAPSIVAYLSPPQPHSDEAQPAMGWQVLRFSSAPPPDEVVPDPRDEKELTRFLTEVLDRTSRRHQLGPL